MNYSDAHLEDAKSALTRLYTALKNAPPAEIKLDWNNAYAIRFKAAMDDDFNTPEAMAVLFELAGEVNKSKNAELAGLLKAMGSVVGLLQRLPEIFLRGESSGDDERIDSLVKARQEAKLSRNFAEADRIRDELKGAGIILEDGPHGTTWRRA